MPIRYLDEQPTSETLSQEATASISQDTTPDYLKALNADTILNDDVSLDEGALDKLSFASKEIGKAYLKGSATLARGVGGLITFAGDNLRVPKDVMEYSKEYGYGLGANMEVKDKLGATLSTIGSGISEFFRYGEEADIIQPDQEIVKGSFLDNPSWTRALSIVSGSLPNMAAGGFVGMASKPILGIAFMTGLESEDVYRDAKAMGKSQLDADLLFGATAAGVGTLEAFLSPIGGNIGASVSGFKQYIVNGVTGGFKEGATEGFQQVYENMVRKIGLDNTTGLLDGVVESIIGGVGSGGAISFISTETKAKVEKIVSENNISPEEVGALVEETAKSITQNREEIDAKIEQNIGKTNTILNDIASQPEQSASHVQKMVNRQLLDVGVEAEQAEATSRLYEARSLAASRALGVSPMDWYAGLRLSFQNESMAQVSENVMQEIPFTQETTISQQDKNYFNSEEFLKSQPDYTENEDVYFQNVAKTTKGKTTFNQDDLITIDNKKRSTVNANNKPIAQTKKDIKNFWDWFGNSKVVDSEGKPLVVYHGTVADFEAFDPSKSGSKSKTGAPYGSFFFSNKSDVASSYTVAWQGDFSSRLHDNASIIPAYVSIKKPMIVNAKGDNWNDIFYKNEYMNINDIVSIAQQEGKYDGVIIKNVSDKGVGDVTSKKSTTYVSFDPTQIKSVNNQGTFDPNDPRILYQKRAKITKGQITFKDTETILKLFKDADASTLVHETGHLFLRDYKNIASVTDEKSVIDDFNVIKQWLGSEDGVFTRKQEEMFARGFEQYMREGKAPTSRLKSVFDKFKTWLTSIYKSASDLNVEINDDIRRVFGNMLNADLVQNKLLTELNQSHKVDLEYAKNRNMQVKKAWNKKTIKENIADESANFAEKASEVRSDIDEYASKSFAPISTRLGDIDSKLKHSVRRYIFESNKQTMKDKQLIKGFVEKRSKMTPEDYADFDFAAKNADVDKIDFLVKKYGIEKEYKDARAAIDGIYDRALDVGLDMDYLEEYFPRVIKDPKGLYSYFRGSENWSSIEVGLKKADPENLFTQEEKAEFINMFLRGYGYDKIGLARPDIIKKRQEAFKSRTISVLNADMNEYYEDTSQALIRYVDSMNAAIESRRFFGFKEEEIIENELKTQEIKSDINKTETKIKNLKKGLSEAKREETKIKKQAQIKEEQDYKKQLESELQKIAEIKSKNLQGSIGNVVLNLVQEGVIDKDQEAQLKDIFKSLIEQKGTRGIIQLLKNSTYIYTMGSPISALTQLGDFAFSLYKNGYYRTAQGITSFAKGDTITKEDLYLENIIEEFTDKSTCNKAVNKVFKMVGLDFMDKMGKEVFVSGAHSRLTELAKSDNDNFNALLKDVFGNEANEVKADLINGYITENVKFLLFCELADIQPIAASEMPEYYLRGGNLRVFYMLKSYTLKLLDLYRRDVFRQIASPDVETRKDGLKNLFRLSAAIMITGVPTDMLKDFLLCRSIDISNIVLDNMLKLSGLSKYQIYKAKQDGIGTMIYEALICPPLLSPLSDLSRDIYKTMFSDKKYEVKDWRTWNGLPFFGKFYYWWFGGGYEKEKKKQQKENG